jgi:hypothetical protein
VHLCNTALSGINKRYGPRISTSVDRANSKYAKSGILNAATPELNKFNGWITVGEEAIPFPHPEQAKVEKSLTSCYNVKDWEIPVLKDAYFSATLLAFKHKLLFWEEITQGKPRFVQPITVLTKSIFGGQI